MDMFTDTHTDTHIYTHKLQRTDSLKSELSSSVPSECELAYIFLETSI